MSRDFTNPNEEVRFYIKHQRPEELAKDPLQFYTKKEVKEYAESKSLMRIQEKITNRVLSIANIDPPGRVLDLGMGCGFASTYLHINGFHTVGIDLNRLFLTYYDIHHLNPIQANMRWFGFRPHSFNLIISISAVQWLLTESNYKRRKRYIQDMIKFCAQALEKQGKVVMQFYPKSDMIMKEFGSFIADLNLFEGQFIVDNTHSPKKRKIYLSLIKK